jgi:hypothetical protein
MIWQQRLHQEEGLHGQVREVNLKDKITLLSISVIYKNTALHKLDTCHKTLEIREGSDWKVSHCT